MSWKKRLSDDEVKWFLNDKNSCYNKNEFKFLLCINTSMMLNMQIDETLVYFTNIYLVCSFHVKLFSYVH